MKITGSTGEPKIFSLFFATTALWASSASENIATNSMKTNTLMDVDVARILPLYHKTVINNSGARGWNAVLALHDLNGVQIARLKDENGGPVEGSMVVSMADLQGISLKLNTPGKTFRELHITDWNPCNTWFIKLISDNNMGLNLFMILKDDMKSIGFRCLSDCTGLTKLYLSPLSNVTTIGVYFLSRLNSLTYVTVKKGRLPSLLKIIIKD